MTATRRTLGLGALAAAALAAAPRAALAYGGDGYSVSGRKGPYVKQVAGRSFGLGGNGGAMGLTSDAVNLGRYQAARLRMPQTEAKVAALLGQIDAKWPYAKGQPLQVHILGVDYYNAYSLPDGSIVVAFGLLDQAQSDDEVAFVLAHELGHVRLGHFARQAAAPTRQSAVNAAAEFLVVSSALQAGGMNNSAVAAATQAAATTDLIRFLTTVMVEPQHTRAQEDEADCIGYDLSQAAAFSADSASAKVFDTIQADQQKRTAVVDTLNTQLKAQLSHAITSGNAMSLITGNTTDLRNGLLEGAGRLALSAAAARNSEAPPQHRPPEERKRGMAEYSAAAYPEGAPLRDEQHGWLTAVRATSEFAQAKVAVAGVADTQRARAAGHYAEAHAALLRARQTSYRNAPLVLNEAARLSDDMGDAAGAERLFQQANASPDQTVDGYVDHVRMLFRLKQYDRALAVASEGVARFGNDDKPFISLRIAINREEGRSDVDADLQRCESYGNPALTKDCRLAAGKSAEEATPAKQTPSIPNLPFGLPHF
jgi:Zn-dependent protease with chaperone function